MENASVAGRAWLSAPSLYNPKMDKAAWIDAFVVYMTRLGVSSGKLGQLAEELWPHFGALDPGHVAEAEHAAWDAPAAGDFPDTQRDRGE